jgi:dTDP-4-amino-4,6-dideoxygalactose transaminase
VNISVPFNDPFISEKSRYYISDALSRKNITGPGYYCSQVNTLLTDYFAAPTRITTSCTSALEIAMAAIRLRPGDEVILPSYTFTSTANCIVQRGATPVFVDIDDDLFINIDSVHSAITGKTKAIIAVPIAGNCGDMHQLKKVAQERSVFLIEDAAQAFGAVCRGKKFGTFGDLATISFHGTKNITCGEGGCIVVNKQALAERIDVIIEKGTNRKQFYEGSINKYEWIDEGGSYIPSDIIAAFLLGNLECYREINAQRMLVWNGYNRFFKNYRSRPVTGMKVNPNCSHNAHMYYLLLESCSVRSQMISFLRENGIGSAFHYIPLHSSPAGKKYGRFVAPLKKTDDISSRLLRLPLSTHTPYLYVIEAVQRFFDLSD